MFYRVNSVYLPFQNQYYACISHQLSQHLPGRKLFVNQFRTTKRRQWKHHNHDRHNTPAMMCRWSGIRVSLWANRAKTCLRRREKAQHSPMLQPIGLLSSGKWLFEGKYTIELSLWKKMVFLHAIPNDDSKMTKKAPPNVSISLSNSSALGNQISQWWWHCVTFQCVQIRVISWNVIELYLVNWKFCKCCRPSSFWRLEKWQINFPNAVY